MKIRKIRIKLFGKSVNKKEEETGMRLRQVLVSSSLIYKLPARCWDHQKGRRWFEDFSQE